MKVFIIQTIHILIIITRGGIFYDDYFFVAHVRSGNYNFTLQRISSGANFFGGGFFWVIKFQWGVMFFSSCTNRAGFMGRNLRNIFLLERAGCVARRYLRKVFYLWRRGRSEFF